MFIGVNVPVVMPSLLGVVGALVIVVLVVLRLRAGKKRRPTPERRADTGLAVDVAAPLTAASLPFHGVRVVDLSTVLAGPISTRIMADLVSGAGLCGLAGP